ncbi:SusC/RagA family TonB-linked outer membrane protein, partial [Phocaeicola vulgatus]
MNLKELARKAVSTLFLSMLCLVAFAQTATGLVKDKTGEPMIGVNVLVKGTTNGTITDFDGKFSIPDVPSNATLVVSYIGYLTKEVKTGKDLVIVLEEDNKTLDEVVVIGYGTVKRRDLTGSVASVTGEKLAANPVANVAQALQGQLPGVSVTSQDGRPGAGMSIRIRGGGSITQSNDPLFIVDGVQVSGIDDIPADNIESIDVLKDAASTAIYGARGANGVILVTTKGGKDGRVSVKYNMYYQMKENPKLLETMDPYDYVYNTWAYMKSLGDSYGDGVARYFGLGSKYGNHLNEYKNMTTHNYINDLMQTASSWNHDVSLSGGTDKTKFYSSVNYMDDEGIRVKSGFQRWNANFKLTQKINKKLTADFDLRYSEIEINGSGFGNATSAYTYRPVDNPLGDASFTAGFGQGDTNMEETSNPLYYLNTVDYIKNMYRIRAKGALTWNVIKGLTAKTELSLNRNWNQEKTWNAGQTEKDNSSAKLKKSDGYGVRWATTLNYEVQGLGDNHNLSFLVGNEVLASKSDYTEIYGVGYPEGFTMDDAFGMINMTTPSLGQDYFKGEIGT